MNEKKESRLSERIMIWVHNESDVQKLTEENLQDIPETVGKMQKLKNPKIAP